MSSFVVSKETINRIVTYLSASQSYVVDKIRAEIATRYRFDLTTNNGSAELGKFMLQMNCRATNERYGEESEYSPLFTYSYVNNLAGDIAVIKSLECWLYQCAEGTIAENDDYKFFSSVRDTLIRDYVHSSKEYQNAVGWE